MRHYHAVWFAIFVVSSALQVAWGADVFLQLSEQFNRYEAWANNKRFVWDVEVSIEFQMNQKAYENLQRTVRAQGGQVSDRSHTYKTSFQISAARKGNQLVITGKGTNGSTDTPFLIYMDQDYYLVGAYPLYAMPVGTKPETIKEAYVFAADRNLLYDCLFPQPLLFWEPGYEFFYGLLINVSPLRFYKDRPKFTRQGDLIRFEGDGSLMRRRISLTADLNGRVYKLICRSPDQPAGYSKNLTYSLSNRQVDDVRVFGRISFEKVEKSPEQQRRVNIVFQLRAIEPLSERDADIQLPLGTLVSDFRTISENWDVEDYSRFFSRGSEWAQVIRYSWQGHLPDMVQLQQLAYQQGNLVPPEVSRRRYSLWLFVPAALFFLAAAYLYLRGKRR
jgi:hypothetical protein